MRSLQVCMLAALLLGWGRAQEARDWGLWPLVTPLLGDISAECQVELETKVHTKILLVESAY